MITKAAYHLEAQVSVLPEFLAKGGGISAIERGGGNNSIYKANGTIYTDFINNWAGLSAQDKTKVVNKRERLGLTRNSPKKGRDRKTSAVGQKKAVASLLKYMKKSQRQLKPLKGKGQAVATMKVPILQKIILMTSATVLEVNLRRRRRPSPIRLDSSPACVCISFNRLS